MPFWSIRTTRASARFSKRCRNTKRSSSIAFRPPRTSQPSHSSGSRAFMTRITASTCGLPKCVYMKRPIAGRMSCGMDTPLKTDREAYGSIRRRHMYAAHAADSRVGARIGLSCGRHQRYRLITRGSRLHPMDSGRLPRRDGLYGQHGSKRPRSAELVPGAQRVISGRVAYLPAATVRGQSHDWRASEHAKLAEPDRAVVSMYARGRDYHKVVRQRLQKLAERIEAQIGPFGYRVFADSAPVLEVEFGRKAGIGWRGKHTLLLQRDAGSFFFLGELYVDIPLLTDAQTAPSSAPQQDGAHC